MMAQKEAEAKMGRGVTLIGIVVFIAIVSLIAALSISKFLYERISTNESVAQEVLKTVSLALEKYAQDHNGVYADNESKLLTRSMGGEADLPYLNRSYCAKTENGYTYNCDLATSGYTLTARPQNCITMGNQSFTLISGGTLSKDATCTPSSG
jgi:Tfp pilus assembly protein PilE